MKDGADNSPKCFKSFRSCHVRVLRHVLLGNLASVFYSSVHSGILTRLSDSLSLHTNIPTNILDEHRGLLESYSDSAHLATYGCHTCVVLYLFFKRLHLIFI